MLEAKPFTVINHGDGIHLLPHLQGTEEQKVTAAAPLQKPTQFRANADRVTHPYCSWFWAGLYLRLSKGRESPQARTEAQTSYLPA